VAYDYGAVIGTGSVFDTWQNGGNYVPGIGTLVTGPVVTSTNGIDPSYQMNISLKEGSNLVDVLDTKSLLLSSNAASAANRGYFMFVRGDRDPNNTIVPNTNVTTLSATGKLQTGTQTFPISGVHGWLYISWKSICVTSRLQ
jgi:hypothetical protein